MSKAREIAELGAVYDSGALSNRNLIINGAMTVSQRGTSETGVTATQYADAPDRFKAEMSSAGTWTLSQSTTAPDGFSNSYKFDCTTADASLSAGDYLQLSHYFEGQNLQHLQKGSSDAKKLTLSFHVRSAKTGTYIAEFYDADNNRAISKSYTINSANTWEYKTITIDGDTTGAFDNDNAGSFAVFFFLAAGSNFTSGTLNTSWNSRSIANSAVGQVNLADSTSNDWYITGVQLELGESATPFEHRSYGDELARCQRYYVQSKRAAYASIFGGAGWANTTGSWIGKGQIPVPMRAAPTVAYSGTARVQNGQAGYNLTSLSASLIGDNLTTLSMGGNASGLTLYNPLDVDAGASTATFDLDAEL